MMMSQYYLNDITLRCYGWVEFVFGPRPSTEFFLQVLWYLSLHKRPTLQILCRPWTVIDESALRGTTAKTLFI